MLISTKIHKHTHKHTITTIVHHPATSATVTEQTINISIMSSIDCEIV
jgi:hypothetical protein